MLFPQHKGSKSFRTCKLFRKKNDVFLKIILGLSTGVNVLGIPYSTIGQGVSKYVFDMKFCRWTIFRYVQTKNVSRKEHVFRYLLMFLEQVFYFIHFVPIECVSRVFQTPQRAGYKPLRNVRNSCSCSFLVVSFISLSLIHKYTNNFRDLQTFRTKYLMAHICCPPV